MPETVPLREVVAMRPSVRLVAYTAEPAALAVASARTCYASDFVYVGRLGPKGERQRTDLLSALPEHAGALEEIGRYDTPHERRIELAQRIGRGQDEDTRNAVDLFADLARQRAETDVRITQSIYEAGHHTPFQHPTFVFALEGVSRNVVESFLHQHTFYNSEQQSQRYVEMKRAEVAVPAAIADDPEARRVFDEAVRAAWEAYHALRERLVERNLKVMSAIARVKQESPKQARQEAEKKSQEMARYVIPVAAATKLYHTVSGIVLLRYLRMSQASSTPTEAAALAAAMAEEVRRVDPTFFDRVTEAPHEPTALPEWTLTTGRAKAGAAGGPMPMQGADAAGGALALAPAHTSRLVRATEDAEALVAEVVREVTGTDLPDPTVLARILDPGQNAVLNDTLNTWDHSPVLRALRHVHYTFRKRQSLTAYAQDQRHRLTPGTRPMLQRAVHGPPDVYVPDIIASDPEARRVFDDAIASLWTAMARLRNLGIADTDAAYLLPNATNIYYTQSGDLLSWMHKWRLRLCFNAQKEIFDAALDELRQVQALHPSLTQWIGPPCSFVSAALPPEAQDDVAACCPEGPRWCGIKVWKNFDADKGTPRRPY